MRYVLDSATIVEFGTYSYFPLTHRQACAWVATGSYLPFLGDETTCQAFGELFNITPPKVNSQTVRMNSGDEALVIRLELPEDYLPDSGGKPKFDMDFVVQHSELGLLRKL